jgi:hypothetical protein
VDLAFWFTFAGYKFVPGTRSRRDLDLASYGVVKMVPGGPGAGALFCALSRSPPRYRPAPRCPLG